jgi:hypothetical protein
LDSEFQIKFSLLIILVLVLKSKIEIRNYVVMCKIREKLQCHMDFELNQVLKDKNQTTFKFFLLKYFLTFDIFENLEKA